MTKTTAGGFQMLNFCSNCGEKLPIPNPKFCPNCGKSLVSPEELEKPHVKARAHVSIQDLGKKLEECVEKILNAKGYETELRRKIEGKSGGLHEIDVVAKKRNVIWAVECKNWANPIGIEQVRDFWAKLQDLGSRWNGIFVSFKGFTEPAEKFADKYNIDRWDQDFLKEEWLAVSVGRAEYATLGQTKTVKNALPLNLDFSDAAKVDFQNMKKISATGMLSYHPYFVVAYSYSAKFKDPTKKTHTFKDKGKVFIDALDGAVLNPLPARGIGTVTRTLKLIVSKDAREENWRNKKLIEELQYNVSIREYNVKGGERHKVRLMEPVVSPRSVARAAIEFVTEKNTATVKYTPKEREEDILVVPKTVTYVPKRRDINIKSITLVNLPRWDLNFEAFGKTYSREILACSGTVLENTLEYCPKHIGPFKKENVAVCEICGQALCVKHVFPCPTCGKWLCEEHGTFCQDCQRIFCHEHITLTCGICNQPLCSDCKVTCPLCKREYGQTHTVRCSQCRKEVCPECVTVTRLIRKKHVCKECQAL